MSGWDAVTAHNSAKPGEKRVYPSMKSARDRRQFDWKEPSTTHQDFPAAVYSVWLEADWHEEQHLRPARAVRRARARGVTWCHDAPRIIFENSVVPSGRGQLSGQRNLQIAGIDQSVIASEGCGLRKAASLIAFLGPEN